MFSTYARVVEAERPCQLGPTDPLVRSRDLFMPTMHSLHDGCIYVPGGSAQETGSGNAPESGRGSRNVSLLNRKKALVLDCHLFVDTAIKKQER